MSHTYYFEKMEVWKLAILLSKKTYEITKGFPKEETYGLTAQIRRSAISVASNIAEGSARTSYKDQARFTQIAYSSTIELLNQLIIAETLGYLPKEKLNQLRINIEEITRMLNGLRKAQLSRVSEPEAEYQYLESTNTPPLLSSFSPPFFVHPTAVIDEGCEIGKGTKIWHFSHIMPKCIIGEKCNIGQNVVISPEVILGRNVKVQNNVSIYTGVICQDDVFLGPSMVFTNVINPRSAVNRRGQYRQTLVKKGASIGANATIICGNEIGEYALIGAGTVLTKLAKPYALIVGNPGQQIGWVSQYGHRLNFDETGSAQCPESGQHYSLKDGQVELNNELPST